MQDSWFEAKGGQLLIVVCFSSPKSKHDYHELPTVDWGKRYQISILLAEGISFSLIAQKIGVHRSTISRELKRSGQSDGYLPNITEQRSQRRKANAAKFNIAPEITVLIDKSQCTMWVYGCGGDKPAESLNNMPSPPNIVLYDYQDGRGGIHPNTFLSGYHGLLQVDGYAGYHGLLQVDGYAGYHGTDAMLAGCWAHARRKFIEAKAVQPKGKTGRADQALNLIQKLYGIEKSISQLSIEDKRAAR